MDPFIEAIKQAESDLINTREELRLARELVATLEEDAKRIEIELVGMRSFAKRTGLADAAVDQAKGAVMSVVSAAGSQGGEVVPISAAVTVLAVDDKPSLLLMSRNEAVATVMAESGVAMDRSAIHTECALGGRGDTLDEISLSLSGLKRAGRVERLGKGLWRLADE